MTPRRKTDDVRLKAAILGAAFERVVFDGFTDKVLAVAARKVGANKILVARLFPKGALSLIEAFSHEADTQMEQSLRSVALKRMKVRERIEAAVKARIAALRPHKEAARRAAAFLSLPPHAALGAKLVYRTVDAMWRAAGDTSTDFNFYTKRAILAGVYTSTLVRWFTDTTDDDVETTRFLNDRIENVMQFEKFKATLRQGMAGFPSLSQLLAAVELRRS